MNNIILKAKKDYLKFINKPRIDDIFSVTGFFRYFLYRTSMPFVRDVLFLIIDTLEIYLLFLFLGKDVSTGGILAYAVGLIGTNIWRISIYTLREKLLYYRKNKKEFTISFYIISYLILTSIFWISFILCIFYFIDFKSTGASLIFISKISSNLFSFISLAYFFTAYSLSRIYIPFYSTILTKLTGVIFILTSFKFLGIYSFIIGFFLEKSLSLFVIVKFINKNFKKKRIRPFYPLPNKKTFFKIMKSLPIYKTLLRFMSFSIYNLQMLFVILFVKSYDASYLLEFFLFYQVLRLLILPLKRIGKSLFYDLSTLTIFRDFNTMNRLIFMNLITGIVLSILASSLFFIMLKYGFYTKKFNTLVFELYMLGHLNYIYAFIFFSGIIIILKKILLILEIHIPLILSVTIFEFIFIFYFLYNKGVLNKFGSPMSFFLIAGYFYIWYSLVLISIIISGLWKKFSLIYKIPKVSNDYVSSKKILKTNENKFVLFLKHPKEEKELVRLIKKDLEIKMISKLSYNNIIILFKDTNIGKKDLVKYFTVFISKIFEIREYKDIRQIIPFMFPFYDSSKIKDINFFLKENKINFVFHKARIKDYCKISKVSKSKRAKTLIKLAKYLQKNDYKIPEKLIFKPEFLGIIPIYTKNNYFRSSFLGLIELESYDFQLVKKLINTQLS